MQHPHIEFQKHEQGALILLVFLSLAGLFYISSAFIFNIIFSVIITLSTYPIFLKIKKIFNFDNNRASVLTTISVGLVFVAPIIYILAILSSETYDFYLYIQQSLPSFDLSSKENAINTLLTKMQISENYIPTLNNFLINYINVESIIKSSKSFLLFLSQNALGGVLNTFIFFATSLFCMFFLYRDGHLISEKIKQISPLHDYYDDLLMKETARLSGILTLSIVSISVLQGTAFAIICYFLGLNWLFVGIAIALTSFIPIVGTSLVYVPLAAYLYLTGQEIEAIVVLSLGIAVISLFIDNVLRPFIVSYICSLFKKDNIGDSEDFNPLNHTLIVTISTLGGIVNFGVIGLFLGPIIASISINVLEIYRIRLHSINSSLNFDEQLDNANKSSEFELPEIKTQKSSINEKSSLDKINNDKNNDNIDFDDLDDNSDLDIDLINNEFDNLDVSHEDFNDIDLADYHKK